MGNELNCQCADNKNRDKGGMDVDYNYQEKI